MLVLGRHIKESILIGDHIRVMVTGIQKGLVKLGVECPRHLSVDREEIAFSKISTGTLGPNIPPGVFNEGELFQVKDKLFWSKDPSAMIDITDVVAWRFPEGTPAEKMIVRVGPVEDAKR